MSECGSGVEGVAEFGETAAETATVAIVEHHWIRYDNMIRVW